MEISGTVFCFAGKFGVNTRPLELRLQRLGGTLCDFDSEDVQVVVLGAKAKSKQRSATKRGLRIMTLDQLESALQSVAAAAAAASAAAPKRSAKPVGPDTPYALMLALNEVDASDGDAIVRLALQARENGVGVDVRKAAPGTIHDEPCWLLAWCSDADGCAFYVLPASALDKQRQADLRAARGLCFAESGDVTPDRFGAALRLIAGLGHRDAQSLFQGWSHVLDGIEQAAGIASAADLVPHAGWLQAYFTSVQEDLRRPFVRVIAVNRAM